MNNRIILFISLIIVAICCTSCVAAIDTAAANSASAIIATIFEGLYAIVVLLLVFVCWISRGIGFASIVFGFIVMVLKWNLIIPSWILISAGMLLLIISFIPIRPYYPTVIISDKLPSTIKAIKKDTNKFNVLREVLLPLIIAIITLLIEYIIFVPRI